MSNFPPGMDPNTTTLVQAWDWMKDHFEDGAHCLLCGQYAKIYPRNITATSGLALIKLYLFHRAHPGEYAHLMRLVKGLRSDETKMRFWGLIEGEEGLRPDGSSRIGYWRITPAGIDFVLGRTKLPRYAKIYDNRLVELTEYTRAGKHRPPVTIHGVLGTRFSYDALMRGDA